MYTVCPKCTLALAVAAADLRAGQGYVRCGRCTNVFNALLNLRDETDTSPGLALDEATTASLMPEPTPLPAEDRRARARSTSAAPQPELDLDLSPPAMPVPAADPEPMAEPQARDEPLAASLAELDLEVTDVGIEGVALDLTVPDPTTDEAALDLVVESGIADEPDLDIMYDPAIEHELALRRPPIEAAQAHSIQLSGAAVANEPFGQRAPAAAAPVAPLPAARPPAARPPLPPAAAAVAAPREPPRPLAEPPRAQRTLLPPQGLTPLSGGSMRAPLPTKGLTPLHATPTAIKDDSHLNDEFRGTGTYETIVLQGDSILQTEEQLPEQEFDDRIAAVAQQLNVDGHGLAGQGRHGKRPVAPLEANPAPLNPRAVNPRAVNPPVVGEGATSSSGSWPLVDMADDDEVASDSARAEALAADIAAAVAGLGPNVQQRRPRWMVAAVLLLALLGGLQAIHHWRNRLATLPVLNAPLTRAYAALGVTLAPDWDLAAYDLRLLGASADPQDTRVIHVRLSLASHASVAQALPLVRLRLIDRYGRPLSAGDLQPAQYLPPGQPQKVFLQPDQRIDSDVRVLDPSQQASSFELDVCLPRPGGGLHCAGDLPFTGVHS